MDGVLYAILLCRRCDGSGTSMTELRVTYKDGKPHSIKFGYGMMGETISLAYVDSKTANVSFDNAGSTDFEKELLKLPFVEVVE